IPTPPVKRDSIVSHLTDGTRKPYSIDAEAIFRTSITTLPPFSGENPTSCMSRNATTNMTTRMRPRSTKGTPRLVCWAINPPRTEPPSIATPVTTCPRPKPASSAPVRPPACYPARARGTCAGSWLGSLAGRRTSVSDFSSDDRTAIPPLLVRPARAPCATAHERLAALRVGNGFAWGPGAHQSHVFRPQRIVRRRLDLRSGLAPFAQPADEFVRRGHDL